MDHIYITYHDSKPLPEQGSVFIFALELSPLVRN